jgi:hypothetical protein
MPWYRGNFVLGGYEVNMPLHTRSIAVSISVVCFFVLSLIGWMSGLPPFVCCKRAIAGAVIVYITGSLMIRAINAILIDAMIMNKMNQSRDSNVPVTHKVRNGGAVGGRNS